MAQPLTSSMSDRDVPLDLGIEIDRHARRKGSCPVKQGLRKRNDGLVGMLGHVLREKCQKTVDHGIGGFFNLGLLDVDTALLIDDEAPP